MKRLVEADHILAVGMRTSSPKKVFKRLRLGVCYELWVGFTDTSNLQFRD